MLFDQLCRLVGWLGELFLGLMLVLVLTFGIALIGTSWWKLGIVLAAAAVWFYVAARRNSDP